MVGQVAGSAGCHSVELGVEGQKVATSMKLVRFEHAERWQRHMQGRWLKIKSIIIRRVIVY